MFCFRVICAIPNTIFMFRVQPITLIWEEVILAKVRSNDLFVWVMTFTKNKNEPLYNN